MDERLETKNSIVAFLDLLGTSEAIKNDEYNTNLHTMSILLQTALDMCEDNRVCKELVKVKSFSDNIVFSTEIPDDIDAFEKMARVHNILEICAYFQIAAFGMGIATRGGITIGGFFCNDIFVWGKGLLRAYNLENKVAIYPRIILDTSVVELMPERDDAGNKHHAAIDADGIVFLDYLSFFSQPTRNEYIKRSLKGIEYICPKMNVQYRKLDGFQAT